MASTLFEMAHNFLRPLIDRLEEDEQDLALDEVRELLFGCGVTAAVLDKLVEMLHNLLDRGIESRKASFLQKELADIVELALGEVYPRVRAITESSALPEAERLSNLGTLDDFSARAQVIRKELEELESWLERPAPVVDLAKIIGNEISEDYKGYVDTADLER
jgi:hypothetical protein